MASNLRDAIAPGGTLNSGQPYRNPVLNPLPSLPIENTCKSAVSSFGPQPQQEPLTNLISTCTPAVPSTVFNTLAPYLYEYDDCVRVVRDYKKLTRQFMEHTGKRTIGPFPGGVELVSVYVSGPENFVCVTDIILLANNLTKGCANIEDGQIVIDTNRINEYTGGDIAVGFEKLIQCTYIVNDISFTEKKTTTSTKFAESTVTINSKDICGPTGQQAANIDVTLPGNQLFSNVYAINTANVLDDSPNYGQPITGADAVSITPSNTSNCGPGAPTTACGDNLATRSV